MNIDSTVEGLHNHLTTAKQASFRYDGRYPWREAKAGSPIRPWLQARNFTA